MPTKVNYYKTIYIEILTKGLTILLHVARDIFSIERKRWACKIEREREILKRSLTYQTYQNKWTETWVTLAYADLHIWM